MPLYQVMPMGDQLIQPANQRGPRLFRRGPPFCPLSLQRVAEGFQIPFYILREAVVFHIANRTLQNIQMYKTDVGIQGFHLKKRLFRPCLPQLLG